MQVWFNGRLFENQDTESDMYEDTPQESPIGDIDKMEQIAAKKVDPSVVVKRINLRDKLYANVINFIRYNIGDNEDLDTIKEYQGRIYDLFDELADEVSDEYNANKGKSKENSKVRDDAIKRKINTIYRFFAYYIIKYDKNIVEWMESLMKKGLFNDKSGVLAINGAYNNIDIDNVFQLEPSELVPENFYILDKHGEFNKTQDDFFKDSGNLVDSIGRSSGVFNSLPQLLTTFRRGIIEEMKVVNGEGKKTTKTIAVPVGNTVEIKQVVEIMTAIDAIINKTINVESIRNKFINDYSQNLTKLNLNQEQIKERLNSLREGIKNGQINTVSDFNKIQNDFKKYASSEKEKEQLGDRTARMASAYKYKIEATLNNKRGSENV
jgi:hypothetical protein